ncbi:MAG TPA: PAS domain S-box protein [Vicinamibacterales bacterium]|nr:PAS domain S-box protein [Vicinamibacterales bacterium]
MDRRAPFNPTADVNRFLAAIVASSDDAIVGKDLDGVIVTWNQGAERLYGYSADEVRGCSIALLMPDDRPDELAAILDRVRAGQRVEHQETVRRTKDGRLVHVSLTVSPVRDVTGTVIGAATVARDLTVQKESELALNVSEARWRAVIESAVDGIVVIDSSGRIEAFNAAAERLFGYREADLVGRNVNVLMPPPYHAEHDGYIARYLATGVPKIIGYGREVTALRRDGTTFPVHLAVAEMTVNGERKFTGILHDLTARVRLEEQLRERTAMARLGEMAAVIAHEVKNPLAGIRGAIQVIGSRLPAGSREAVVVKEVIARIDGLNDLIKDLLLFARPPQPRPTAVDVAALVSATASLLANDPATANVRVEIRGAAPPITADPDLLRIVFVNLLVNGAHAMQGSGVIRVSVTNAGPFCQMAFQDSGPGIPADIRDKVFTPFFTTKSKGTGLGLATVKRLIDAHTGRVDIQCPPDGGTIVTIQLPAGAAALT